MTSRRAFELTFIPTPKSKVQHTYTRFYVAELGDDATNHAYAMRLVRQEYPKALAVSVKEVPAPGGTFGGLLNGGEEVGEVIAEQMGGPGRLRLMLGAKQVVLIPNGLKIAWPNKDRTKGNIVIITLRPDDTYDMEFFNKLKSVKKFEGVYADALVRTFESHTGWALSLGGR